MEDEQQTLYGEELPDTRAFYELLNHAFSVEDALDTIDKINWDFKNFNTQYLTHRFHSYPARFIPQIPYSFIKLFTNEGDTVLDPMCGSGTTIVEAFLNNRNAIGNDFNPLSTLITKVKTTMISNEDFVYLDTKLRTMKRYMDLDYKRVDERLQTLPNRKVSKIFNKMVDLIVTSPPYVNALDYYRTHMYNMLWLGKSHSA